MQTPKDRAAAVPDLTSPGALPGEEGIRGGSEVRRDPHAHSVPPGPEVGHWGTTAAHLRCAAGMGSAVPPHCHTRVAELPAAALWPHGSQAELTNWKAPYHIWAFSSFLKEKPEFIQSKSTSRDAEKGSWLLWGSNLLPDTAPCSFGKVFCLMEMEEMRDGITAGGGTALPLLWRCSQQRGAATAPQPTPQRAAPAPPGPAQPSLHPSTALRPREEFNRLLRSFPGDRCLLAAPARGAERPPTRGPAATCGVWGAAPLGAAPAAQ